MGYSVTFNNNFVVKIINAMSKNEQISVPDDQIGNLCNVFDLAKVIGKIVSRIESDRQSEKETPWGLYHVSPLGFESRHNIAERILHTANVSGYTDFIKTKKIIPITTESINSPVNRPLNSRLNSRKFFNTFSCGMSDWCFSLHNATQKIIQRLKSDS